MKFTIKYKLTSIILITVIPMFILSTQHYSEMLSHNKQMINSRNQEIAAAVALDLDQVIADSHNILLPLAKHPAVMAKNTEQCDRLFASLIPAFTNHLNIMAAGMDGFSYGSGVNPTAAKGLNVNDKEWFQRGSQGIPTVGDSHVSKIFKVPAVMMTAPVFGPGGVQTGVLGFPLNLAKVNGRLASLWKFSPNSFIRVLDTRGDIIIDTLKPGEIGTPEIDPRIIGKAALKKVLSDEGVARNGVNYLYSYAPLKRAPWTVVVAVPSAEAYSAVNWFAGKYLAILLLVAFGATALAFFLIRQINNNVATLVSGLQEVEHGNLDSRMIFVGNNELTVVAESYNRMSEERLKADHALEEAKEKYRKLYDNAPDMMHSIDAEGKILICNKTEATILGYSPDSIIGRPFTDFVSTNGRDACVQKFSDLMEQGFIECELEILTKDGTLLPVFVKSKVIRDEQGRFLMADVILRDITERRQAEHKIRDAELSYRTLFEQSPEGIVLVDAATLLPVMFNDTACGQLGYSRAEFSTMLITAHEADDEPKTAVLLLHENGGEQRDNCELKHRTRDGEFRNILASIRRIELSGSSAIFCIFRDVTEIKRNEAALRENEKRLNHLAHHDPLTNLPNRILFYDRLKHAIAKASRMKKQVAVLFLDLDRFKNINDTLGHKAGDQVLCKMAKLLKGLVRESDTIARLGGDEFLITLEELDDLSYAGIVAQNLLSALAKAVFAVGQEIYLTGSIGISIFPTDSGDMEGLMKCADVAMYRAKSEGRNNYQFYTPDMNARAHELLRLESNLRKALEQEQLVIFYQPQIEVESGKLVGLEALVRWQHPSEGMILPNDFIYLAEETGLIVPIGEWVLRTACQQSKIWQDQGFPPVHIAVNISGRQFRHTDLVHTVAMALADAGLDPGLLTLEITESVIMNEIESAIETLFELSRMGVQMAIDDFGTGYSSLGYLKRFPISKLKIDRSFISDVTTDPDDAAITSSIIALGLGMNMEVIAEGVETEEQLRFLCEKGCKIAQGFLFSEPLSAEDVAAFLPVATKIVCQGTPEVGRGVNISQEGQQFGGFSA